LWFRLPNYPIAKLQNLLNFFMRRVLTAPTAELFQFQTVGCRFAVLGRRIVPLFAITALQGNNFSGHCSLQTSSWLLALSFWPSKIQPASFC
jgi:hypothetical protein